MGKNGYGARKGHVMTSAMVCGDERSALTLFIEKRAILLNSQETGILFKISFYPTLEAQCHVRLGQDSVLRHFGKLDQRSTWTGAPFANE